MPAQRDAVLAACACIAIAPGGVGWRRMLPDLWQKFFGALLLLVLSACSGKTRNVDNDRGQASGGEGGSGGASLSTVEAFWQAFGDALCAAEIRCGSRRGFEAGACHPWIRATDLHRRPEQIDASLAAGRSRYDSAEAAACLDSIRSGPCELRPADEMLDVVCKAAFVGSVARGSPCGNSLECEDGDLCDGILSVCPGTCTARVAAGESCERDEQCESGLGCVLGPSMNGTCQPVAVKDCGATKTCEAGRVCLEDSTCSPLLGSGAGCQPSSRASTCAGDLVCTDTGGGNFACLLGQVANQTCSPGTPCAPGMRCTLDGSCQPVSRPNEPCETKDSCPVGFACTQGRCTALPVSGEPCSDEMPCLQGACRSGACALLADGEACQTDMTSRDLCAAACYGEVCERPINDLCSADTDCDPGRYCLADSSGAPRCKAICTP